MATNLTVKGQVTIPKKVRDALRLKPGSRVEFDVDAAGQVVLRAAPGKPGSRFKRMQGRAEVKWRTDELMALLRGSE